MVIQTFQNILWYFDLSSVSLLQIKYTKYSWKTTYWKLTSVDDVKSQCVIFSRRYKNIGFQNFVVTSVVLVKTIFTMWRSNLELELQYFSHFSLEMRSSTFNVFTFSQSNSAVHVWAWVEVPVKSHFLSRIVFLCCSILVETFKDVPPTYFFPHLQLVR